MKRSLKIIMDKLSENEEYLLLKKFPDKKDDIKLYQEAAYFQIHKLYYQEFFMGYMVLFLGHHSIESNDASIEDIGFLGNDELLKPIMFYLLNKVSQHKVLTYPFKQVYYDKEKFDDIYLELFSSLNWQQEEQEYCRG